MQQFFCYKFLPANSIYIGRHLKLPEKFQSFLLPTYYILFNNTIDSMLLFVEPSTMQLDLFLLMRKYNFCVDNYIN
jgi:hypothetical protein